MQPKEALSEQHCHNIRPGAFCKIRAQDKIAQVRHPITIGLQTSLQFCPVEDLLQAVCAQKDHLFSSSLNTGRN